MELKCPKKNFFCDTHRRFRSFPQFSVFVKTSPRAGCTMHSKEGTRASPSTSRGWMTCGLDILALCTQVRVDSGVEGGNPFLGH
ncbi:hypothetical protein L596_011306 [Steinernema carpocapsae]|uniref:Uncharacterized protein n=1 Tax=Steinernema carpocapsae TaxID=34508 RepID=A0A4U5NTG9_STECR|nr:hypothetical protein L596_011306 [Steinernema carpocapsae]